MKGLERKPTPDTQMLFALLLLPEVAKEPEIKSKLISLMIHDAFLVRCLASLDLKGLDDTNWLQYLAYNSVAVHPLLKQAQRSNDRRLGKLAKSMILPFVDQLTERSVEILFDDLLTHTGNCQIELLSHAPLNLVKERAMSLLNNDDISRLYGAFILAMNGVDSGRSIIEEVLEKNIIIPYPQQRKKWLSKPAVIVDNKATRFFQVSLALIGISRIANTRAINILEHYTDTHCSGYGNLNIQLIAFLGGIAEKRLMLVTDKKSGWLNRFLEKFYSQVIVTGDYSPLSMFSCAKSLERFNIYGSIDSTADYIFEFVDESEQKKCAETQRNRLECLSESDFPKYQRYCHGLPSLGFNKPEIVQVKIEKEGMMQAASDWILYPKKYIMGSVIV